NLKGGSGADICGVLDGLSGRAKLLYVGSEAQPGADASAEPGDTFLAVELALALLERSESRERERSRPEESAVDWTVDGGGTTDESLPLKEKAAPPPPPAPEPPRAKANGNGRASAAAGERFRALLR